MDGNRFTIWCNNDFAPDQAEERDLLLRGVGSHRLSMFEPRQDGREGKSRTALEAADLAFGSPDAEAVMNCPQLRWIHLHSAGFTSFDRAEIKQALIMRGTVLTNSSAVYDEPCAQHLLAMILGLARGLPVALDAQRGDKSWRMDEMRPALQLLKGQRVLILGFGAIARRLVALLQPFEIEIVAVRREGSQHDSIRIVHSSAVDEFLPMADHVVNILPANEQTQNFLNAARLASLKRGAFIYNIGRGVTLDQSALIKELSVGRIAAAYLDVTDPEPLPPTHPLWTTPNCYITPHIGGGYAKEKERQVNHFLNNLRFFERGDPLLDRIL